MADPKPLNIIVNTQGRPFLDQPAFLKYFGMTDEDGGQVLYALNLFNYLHEHDEPTIMLTRNYEGRTPQIEEVANHRMNDVGGRVVHVGTSAPSTVQKENFYPYYSEWADNAVDFLKKDMAAHEYPRQVNIIGNYADGMFLGSVLKRSLELTGKFDKVVSFAADHSTGISKKNRFKGAEAERAYNFNTRIALERAALLDTQAIVSVSQEHTDNWQSAYGVPKDRVRFMPGGIDFNFWKSPSQKTYSPQEDADKPFVLCGWGRCNPAKGMVNAINAMPEILKRVPNAQYIYFGGSDNEPYRQECLARAEELGVEDHVTMLPGRTPEEVREFVQDKAHVIMFTQNFGGYETTSMEAAGLEVPTILSRNIGPATDLKHREMVLQIDPSDPASIARAVGETHDNYVEAMTRARRAREFMLTIATKEARFGQIMNYLNSTSSLSPIQPTAPVKREEQVAASLNLFHSTPGALSSPSGQIMQNILREMGERVPRTEKAPSRLSTLHKVVSNPSVIGTQNPRIMRIFDCDGTLTENIWSEVREARPALDLLARQIRAERESLTIVATGRPFALHNQDKLIQDFPQDILVCSNGVEIYARNGGGKFSKWEEYESYLKSPDNGLEAFSAEELHSHLAEVMAADPQKTNLVTRQPDVMVSGPRIAYFGDYTDGVSMAEQKEQWLEFLNQTIDDLGMDAIAQVSADPHHNKFNLEIMPSKASKQGALIFAVNNLSQKYGIAMRDFDGVIVGGDSGNDIPMMQPNIWRSMGGKQVALIAPSNVTAELQGHLTKLEAPGNAAGAKVYVANLPTSDGMLEANRAIMKDWYKSSPANTPPSASAALGTLPAAPVEQRGKTSFQDQPVHRL